MKIIVISDTHSNSDSVPAFLSELFDGYEMIIHAGDFDTLQFYKALEATGKLKAVHGNSDEPAVREILPEKLVFEIEGVKIGVIHEASLSIVDNTATRYMALEMGVDVLVFGHLHRPIIEKSDVLLICPGSPTKPRMSDPCAVEMKIENGSVTTNIIPVTGHSCGYIDFSRKLGENEN
jgi:hypothetical protein